MGLFGMAKGPKGLDPNSLTPFERAVFASVADAYFANVVFLSLRLQLHEWLSVESVRRMSGIPNWWKRRSSGNQVIAVQERIVGGMWSVPKEIGPVELRFKIENEGQDQSPIVFTIDESVRSVVLPEIEREQHTLRSVRLVGSDFSDDRPYWQSQSQAHPEFQELAGALLRFLSEENASRAAAVVLPAPGLVEMKEIDGVGIAGEYRTLLRFANGIRINSLLVWGTHSIGTRRVSIRDREFLYIGDDGEDLLALEVSGGRVQEEVFKVAPKSTRGMDRNIRDLCREALEST